MSNSSDISRYKTIRRGTTTTTTEAAQKSSIATEAAVTSTAKPRRELTSRRTTTTEATDIINNDTSESKDTIKTIKLETNETLTTPEPIVAPSNNINATNLVSSTTAIPKETVTTSTEAQTSAPASVTPQLLDPRPFSVITRKKPVAGQTETTTPSAKVSEQISSTPGVRQSGIKELYDVNNLSTENSLEDSHTRRNRVKQRGQSRFNLEQVNINRNRIRSTEEVSRSPKETEENNDQPKRIRNPNRNRFTPPPSTESSAEVEKGIRTFRPDVAAEISDLSSLTAADISIKQRGLASEEVLSPEEIVHEHLTSLPQF